MNNTLKTITLSLFIVGLSVNAWAESAHEESGHDEHNESSHDASSEDGGHGDEAGGHEEEGHDGEGASVKLSSRQTSLADIKVSVLYAQTMNYQVYAPGEIRANGYTSYQVSPRVDSVVLRRHVSLGDHVVKGQSLVTLFSETVADAQAAYRVNNAEWKRVKKLGRKTVGDKRYISAESDFEAAYGRLLAFGLTKKAIASISEKPKSLGEYTLIAAIAGAVLSDDFHQGQRIEAGEALIELADETALWIEARLAPTVQLSLPEGTKAKIKVGKAWFDALVTQEAHTIDLDTRTRIVRLLVNNQNHRLHPGQFADVYFSFETKTPVLAVPESALMRGADGDWTVFIEEEPGEFKTIEVELGRSLGKWREIIGIESGERVVMEGAFFVASQIAKGGFDPHNH